MLFGRVLELGFVAHGALGQRAADERDGEEPEQVEADGEARHVDRRHGAQQVQLDRQLQVAGRVHVLREHEADEQHGAQPGDLECRLAATAASWPRRSAGCRPS